LLMRIDEQMASAVASTMAASPPNKSSVRNMKVSETEMCARTCGIGMLSLGPTRTVARPSITNGRVMCVSGNARNEKINTAAPTALTEYM